MTYEQLLAKQPPTSVAGSTSAAAEFVSYIAAFMQGTVGLEKSQQNYLYKLKIRWEKRAAGLDTAWNDHGSRPGRRKQSAKEKSAASVDTTAFGNEEELDPLLSSLMRKYGKPRRTDDI